MTGLPFPRAALNQSICDRFEEQVGRYGARVAVKTGNAELTYDTLNREANRVAHAILARKRPPEEPVALVLEQGAGEIAVLLGILKAGHPFVSLALSARPRTLARLLEDSTARLIVTSAETAPRLRESCPAGSDVLVLDALDTALPGENPALPRSPEALACIMYTSGSTGTPKGVMHTHRTVLHRALTFVNSGAMEAGDRIALLHATSFSASLRVVFGTMLIGAALYPFDVAAAGPDALAAWVARERITIYVSAPSVFRNFAGALAGLADLSALRRVRLSAETLSPSDVDLYRTRFPEHCVLVNALSSNETGTIAEFTVDHAEPLTGMVVPAGYPTEDKEILVVDEARARVSVGQVGEIAVRSRYLSPGYWRRADLTAAGFLPDPAGGDARVYLTGDLGRLMPDGCLEHLGRKDFRVKIRGQQVDVSEVEAALVGLGAKEAVVLGRDDGIGGQRLVAYVVAGTLPPPRVSELRRRLSEHLPAHMIPTAFIMLDALPRTPNGKVDRQSLPSPDPVRPELETPFAAPRTPVEEGVAAIWTETLRLDRVGIHDHFLDLGGHSLAATQVVARITQQFAVDIPVRALFDAPTVATMALVVARHLAARAGDQVMSRLWKDLDGAGSQLDEIR